MTRKTALVTGASSDIGQAVARSLAAGGFNIAAHYYSNLASVRAVEGISKKCDVEVGLFGYDLTQLGQTQEMVDAVVKQFNTIDVLINTIGPFYYRDILDVTPDDWSNDITMNLHIAFNVTYFARKHICDSQGHIINFAFSGAENLKAWKMSAGYCAAKAGIVVFTKSLAASLAPSGVRVNAICPGLIGAGTITDLKLQEMARQIPFGRLGKPEEIADVIRWLVTESPSYLTGALIPVAGAWEY